MFNKFLGKRNFEKDLDRMMLGGKSEQQLYLDVNTMEYYPTLIPPVRGYNNTASSYIDLTISTADANIWGIAMPASNNSHARNMVITPPGFVGLLKVYSLWYLENDLGNSVYITTGWNYRARVEYARNPWTALGVTTESSYGTYAPASSGIYHLAPIQTWIQEPVYIILRAGRKGAEASDLHSDNAMFMGWWMIYGGEKEVEYA